MTLRTVRVEHPRALDRLDSGGRQRMVAEMRDSAMVIARTRSLSVRCGDWYARWLSSGKGLRVFMWHPSMRAAWRENC
jgi:hypothetical protein